MLKAPTHVDKLAGRHVVSANWRESSFMAEGYSGELANIREGLAIWDGLQPQSSGIKGT